MKILWQGLKTRSIIILFVVFVDLLGAGMVFAILPGLFATRGLFAGTLDTNTGNIIFGLLVAGYPLAQLFGAPIFGYLSDIYGRKKIFQISIIGTAVSYLLFIIGINTLNVWILFLSRVVDGLTGGNISVAQTMIVDDSTPKNRPRDLGYVVAVSGIGLIFGPLIGGLLTEVDILGNSLSSPYIFALILTLANIWLVWKFVSESEVNKPSGKSHLHILYSFTQIYRALTQKVNRRNFLASAVAALVFGLFSNFLAKILVDEFFFSPVQLGFVSAYIGIWMGVAVFILLPILGKYLSQRHILFFGFLACGLFTSVLSFVRIDWLIYALLPLIVTPMAILSPVITALLSQESDQKQGETLGVNQSMQALATMVAPTVGGFVINIWIGLPILLAGVVSLLGCFIFWSSVKKESKKLSEEEHID